MWVTGRHLAASQAGISISLSCQDSGTSRPAAGPALSHHTTIALWNVMQILKWQIARFYTIKLCNFQVNKQTKQYLVEQ